MKKVEKAIILCYNKIKNGKKNENKTDKRRF